MIKYHVTSKGELAPCEATLRDCPKKDHIEVERLLTSIEDVFEVLGKLKEEKDARQAELELTPEKSVLEKVWSTNQISDEGWVTHVEEIAYNDSLTKEEKRQALLEILERSGNNPNVFFSVANPRGALHILANEDNMYIPMDELEEIYKGFPEELQNETYGAFYTDFYRNTPARSNEIYHLHLDAYERVINAAPPAGSDRKDDYPTNSLNVIMKHIGSKTDDDKVLNRLAILGGDPKHWDTSYLEFPFREVINNPACSKETAINVLGSVISTGNNNEFIHMAHLARRRFEPNGRETLRRDDYGATNDIVKSIPKPGLYSQSPPPVLVDIYEKLARKEAKERYSMVPFSGKRNVLAVYDSYEANYNKLLETRKTVSDELKKLRRKSNAVEETVNKQYQIVGIDDRIRASDNYRRASVYYWDIITKIQNTDNWT